MVSMSFVIMVPELRRLARHKRNGTPNPHVRIGAYRPSPVERARRHRGLRDSTWREVVQLFNG